MNTLVCAGGSGTRVLEAVIHLCAAGLGPSNLRVFVIDPDTGNGNGNMTKNLIEKYRDCYNKFADKPDPPPYFSTALDLLEVEGQTTGLKIWSPVPAGKKLADILNYSNLYSGRPSPELQKTPQAIARLLFTDRELDTVLDDGFLGHPAIGAATLALLPLYAGSPPWKQLIDKTKIDIALAPGARVFLAGSVFGGTGASAFHPVARFLREIPDQVKGRLKIGVSALLPYFQFQENTADGPKDNSEAKRDPTAAPRLSAKSERFPLATKSALLFYDVLRKQGSLLEKQTDWPFDAVYWLGNDGLLGVPYSRGGSGQKNPAHFVDFLAAVACLDFFKTADTASGACYYCGPRAQTNSPNQNVLGWQDIPVAGFRSDDIWRALLKFVLIGSVHVGFTSLLSLNKDLDSKPHFVPWYRDRFTDYGLSLTTPEFRDASILLTNFFEEYHYIWLRQLHESSTTVRLFNHSAVLGSAGIQERLQRLANLLYPDDREKTSMDVVDAFFTDMVEMAGRAAGQEAATAYLSLLDCAAVRFMNRVYGNEKEGYARV